MRKAKVFIEDVRTKNEKLVKRAKDFIKNNIQEPKDILSKIKNINGKASKGYVPKNLYAKRVGRNRRAYIEWQSVLKNNLTIEQLESFENGVAVAFVNDDFFNEAEYGENETYRYLKDNCIGSNENVSAIIAIKTEKGKASSQSQRDAYTKLLNNTKIYFAAEQSEVIINKDNFNNYIIKSLSGNKIGNDKWTGFLFISIQGGKQDTLNLPNKELKLFNPACEYANPLVESDINLVLVFFLLKAILPEELEGEMAQQNLNSLITDIKNQLDTRIYNHQTLGDYCMDHYCLQFDENQLYDSIQCKCISISNFRETDRAETNIDVTHNEAVIWDIFTWDEDNSCLLSAARPNNLFWSFHLSNMIQQNYTLIDFFKIEEEWVKARNAKLDKMGKL